MARRTTRSTHPQPEFLHDSGSPEQRAAHVAALAHGVNGLLTGPAADELGPFAPGPADHDGHPVNWPGLRSAPISDFGGGQLYHNLGSGDLGTLCSDIIARELQVNLDRLAWYRRPATAQVIAATETALATIEASGSASPPSSLAAVCFSTCGPGNVRVGVDLEMLGSDLVKRVMPLKRVEVDKHDDALTAALADHERRSVILATFAAKDWVGMLDETARLVLAGAGLEVWDVVPRLRTLNRCTFRFDGGRWTATLRWRDGTIVADIHDRESDIGLWEGELRLGAGLPDTLFDSLPGRRLGDVADVQHPYLAPDSVITDAHSRGGARFVRLSVPTSPVELPF